MLYPLPHTAILAQKSTHVIQGLVSKFPDATVEQLKALLAIRGDFSTNEAKEVRCFSSLFSFVRTLI